MTNSSVPMLGLAASLTAAFAQYTGVARHNINPYMSVMKVMDGLIYEDLKSIELVVRDKGGLATKSLKEIVRETLASPLFKAGLSHEPRLAGISGEQANILRRISAYVSEHKLSEELLEPGEAYFLSTMVLNSIHDRQPTLKPDSTIATFDVATYTPKTGPSSLLFAL